LRRLSCIVEGHGEVSALPILLRRVAQQQSPNDSFDVQPPIRVSRSKFLNRDEEFHRHLNLAGSKCGVDGLVLVLLDADDDCPAQLAPEILRRAKKVLPHRHISVVLANREFESWYIGAAASLDGFRGLEIGELDRSVDPETYRDAKGWLRQRMKSRLYGETTDQPAFAARMDLQMAVDRCRSFRKLCNDLNRWITPVAP